MATGVKPRDDEHQFTRGDLEALEDALKNKKFRDLLAGYFEEVRDPANQAIYQKEMTQLEKERGYDVKFINPKGGYVIKTSVAGDRKAFINICSNDNVEKPSCSVKEVDGHRGMNWSIPYSLIPPREDYDSKKDKCVIYDVVFHPDTLRMAEVNRRFRELVNNTASDALKTTYNIDLDCNNFRFPKSLYKGLSIPAVIRKEDPNYNPHKEEEANDINPEVLAKLYPQHIYAQTAKSDSLDNISEQESNKSKHSKPGKSKSSMLTTDKGYTIPKYVIKQQKTVDIQEYTFNKSDKECLAIPSSLAININLPLLSSSKDCRLDVQEKSLSLISDKPAKYKLNITLPYSVDDQSGNAKFDKSKRILTVTLPVLRKQYTISSNYNVKADSGVESEEFTGSQSDDDMKTNLVTEISSSISDTLEVTADPQIVVPEDDTFLESSLGYTLPTYTHNILEDMIAFTFHVKNSEPGSVKVKKDNNKVQIKFTSVGTGFVPVHYAAIIIFEENIKLEEVNAEAWDNNVILQITLASEVPSTYQIGLSEESLISELIDLTLCGKYKEKSHTCDKKEEDVIPVVEVTNFGSETSILVTTAIDKDDEDEDDYESLDREIVWVEDQTSEHNAKSILRKSIARSLSESSAGDIASSMDYVSSDCIPEESSLKKTVRFNHVIARKFYRCNSSIEAQNKKNQKKKTKKRNVDRRKSESEAEDEGNITIKYKEKSVFKQRRDSGLADTSDADTDYKSTPVTSPSDNFKNKIDMKTSNVLCEVANENIAVNSNNNKDSFESDLAFDFRETENNNIKHNTELYNPERLNQGHYTEIKFKNDLIFDLDM